ncbi:MAG: cytochrome c maturation protein CcmE [Acidimicrobiales bacterium]
MELTPRVTPEGTRRRRPVAYAVLVLVLAGLSVVVYQGLTSASLYFYNADEAVAQRIELGDKRFRLQGTVLPESITATDAGVEFTVAYAGEQVDVRHDGDPPELFQPGIPVVLEGRWDPSGRYFASDTIRVKHSEKYEADNSDRIADAERGGAPSGSSDDPLAP